ncbi:hypothetical protein KC950_04510 [Candidatus Saccharibacteria bacterium]|nr:hypothetical protein [Candidatus Saccharibacteria bacterium]
MIASSNRKLIVKFRNLKYISITVLVFVVGLGAGYLIASNQDDNDSNHQVSEECQNENNNAKISKSEDEQLEENYIQSKSRINRDLEGGELTQEQADMILAKLNEVYEYKKSQINTQSDKVQDELQNKQREWKEWLDQNDVSSRYFKGVI